MFAGMCPHCGKVFDKASNLVPNHAYPETPVGGRLCPGSEQNWRNPLSDKRPLWKDTAMAEFMECEGCRAKPGSPVLCQGCQHNRKLIADKDAEIRARGEILDTITKAMGETGNFWSNAARLDWRQRLRDFASDRELHQFERAAWKNLSSHGITLYAEADYFTAYYSDASELWERADDDHPMFHVMVKSDPPHRCCIHAMHLAAWVQLMAEVKLPVQIIAMEDLRE